MVQKVPGVGPVLAAIFAMVVSALVIVLLANLAWSAWLLVSFVRRRTPFAALERWQTGYLPVYAAWAWIVVLVFPPLFSYA